jgi:NADH dehydrogenase
MVPSDVTVWAAGVAAPDSIGQLGLPSGHAGRLEIGADLRITGQDRIFAAGDISVNSGDPVAQLAQPAIQQGRHSGRQIRRLMAGQATQPFSYHDKGTMATIGRASAVVEIPVGIRLRGTLAWLAWLGLHLYTLLGGRNRIVALVNLAWRYLTWSRGGGIIVGDDEPEAD